MKQIKTICLLSIAICYLCACKEVQDPVFKEFDKVELVKLDLDNVQILAEARFYNPNPVSIQVESWDIKVNVNKIDMGSVTMIIPSKIPAKSDFNVPMNLSFPLSKLINKKGGIISGILSTVLDKKLDIHYSGHIVVDVLGVHITVPVEEFEELELSF